MNIKELMEWRQDCFFCHEKLSILPEIKETNAEFTIENNYFIISSRFMNLSIHMETGKISESKKDKIMVDQFLQLSNFKIVCKCLSCLHNSDLYKYSGHISTVSPTDNFANVFLFQETIIFNNCNWYFDQQKWGSHQYGSIWKIDSESTLDTKQSAKNEIKTPFFDLHKMTPKILENKLKTYIVFS